MAGMGDMKEYIQLLVTSEGESEFGEINVTWNKISTVTSVSQESYGKACIQF
jgi:hypothetical protein